MTGVRQWGWVILILTIGCQSNLEPPPLEGVTGAWRSIDASFTLWVTSSGRARILGAPQAAQDHFVRSDRSNRFLIHKSADDAQDPMVLVLTGRDTVQLKNLKAHGGLRLSAEETQLVRIPEQEFDKVLRGWNAQEAARARLRP